jgi:hypothetical protein
MIVQKKTQKTHVTIDLTGPDGNAFVLIGTAQNYAKQLGYSKEERDNLRQEMTEGDYENLLEVFDSHFGHFVILER